MSTKQLMRKCLKKLTELLDPAELRVQSERTTKALRDHSMYKTSDSIAFYMHMDRGEIQTLGMIENAFQDGKRVFLPHIVKYGAEETHSWFPDQKTHLKMLEMPNFAAVKELQPRGKYNLKEPTTGLDCLSENQPGLDLIILPGVGFTKDGCRLGHGAGYYDSFVSEHEHKKQKTPKLIGVGLEEQLVEPNSAIPLGPHDRTLDCVIIGGIIYRESNK